MAAHLSYFAPDESQSHAQASERQIIGLGELLKSARARRGLTLQQVSNETKIPRRCLEAIEQDGLAALAGGFYRRAHVRAYAQAVHFDPGLLAQLERDLKAAWVPIEAVLKRPRRRAAGVLTRTRGLIQIGLLRAAAYVKQALRKQVRYLNTHARNFTSWSQQPVTHVHRSIQTRSAKTSTIQTDCGAQALR
jgi:cytoskeletal protein RodZ